MNRKELEKRVGKIDDKLEKKITDMGTPVEEMTEDSVEVEVFPNRPDLLSLENFARALNQFNGKGKVAKFKVNSPEKNYVVNVEKAVKKVRPYTSVAVVKGLKFTDEKIKSVMEFQEKLHGSYGRNRRKLALGIYPLSEISFPLTYTAEKPDDIKFQPLESDKVMSGRQILNRTQTGRDYAKLLKGEEVFPIYRDAAGEILSMPPIINSHKTGRITEETRDIFIECSGFNLEYLKKTIDLVVSSFVEMGGKVYSLEVKDGRTSFVSPAMEPEEMEFKIEDIEKTLGISLKEKEVVNLLARMGIGARRGDRKPVAGSRFMVAEVPCYRTDILHWIDLTEEIAIAYGYDNFVAEIPAISTIAEEDSLDRNKRIVGQVLAGLGMLECSSFHLTTKKNIKKMHFDYNDFIEVEASKTERDVLRMDMMTNMLQILSENSDAAYPQKIFEMGRVFSRYENTESGERLAVGGAGGSDAGVVETERLAIAMIDDTMGYTEMKQIMDYLFKMLGLEYSVEDVEDSNYITGRVGKIVVNGVDVGRIGEVAPRALRNWKIRMPVVGVELSLYGILGIGN